MLAEERHRLVLREIALEGSLRSAEFAAKLGVPAVTLRRDLRDLEERGLLRRVHGGAVMLPRNDPSTVADPPSPGLSRLQEFLTIGMIVPRATYYYAPVIRGAEQAAQSVGVRLVLGVSDYSADDEVRMIRRMIDNDIDALLITPSRGRLQDTETLALLRELTIPVVVVERELDELAIGGQVESVRTDHEHGVATAVRHLSDRGHRRIALVASEYASVEYVRDGFRRGCELIGATQVDLGDWQVPEVRTGQESRAQYARLISRLRRRRVTAVMAYPDRSAAAVLEATLAAGLRVPEDLAIIAYDDENAALAPIPLTAVAPPKFELGHTALTMAVDRLRGSQPAVLHRTRLLPTLNVRASTSPPGVR